MCGTSKHVKELGDARKSPLGDAYELKLLAKVDNATVVSHSERLWRFILAVAALLELLSYILPYFFLSQDEDSEKNRREQPFFQKHFSFLFVKEHVAILEKNEERTLLLWFDDHRYKLGVLFSILWFAHSFVGANSARQWALRKRDRDLLLRDRSDLGDDDKGKGYAKVESTKNEKEGENEQEGSYVDVAYKVGGSWGVFYLRLIWYLSLLPVGFYMLSIVDIQDIFFGDGWKDDTGAEKLRPKASDDVATYGNRVLTKETKYCLAYATIVYVGKTMSNIASAAVRVKFIASTKKMAARFAKFAIRNPRRAKKRLRKALTVLRWVKYLLPLIGTGNKLLGNSKDLLKKYRQNREAIRAKRIRKKLWLEFDPEERLVQAAVLIQSNFRAHRARKLERALRLMTMERRDAAVLRIQSKLRKRAAMARVRVLQKKRELRELQTKQLEMRTKRKHMAASERRRIYQLQDELGIEFQKRGTGMLLRPNTKFAVAWKVLFVVCVILEITHLAMKPKLAKYKDKETGKPLNMQLILEHILVPDPIEEWSQCLSPTQKKMKSKKSGEKTSRTGAMFANKQKSAVPGKKGSYYGPWFCGEPLRTLSRWLSKAIRFFIAKAIIFVGLICFLDVFVTFFTGELDGKTGVLKPKPFFVRWLLPGLVLQLLVNPMMVNVAATVHKMRRGIHYVGPARVWRWCRAFILPTFTALVTWFEWKVWRQFVNEKNKEIVEDALIE